MARLIRQGAQNLRGFRMIAAMTVWGRPLRWRDPLEQIGCRAPGLQAAFIDDADGLVKKAERRQVSPKFSCRLGLASRSSMGESGNFYMLPERRIEEKHPPFG